MATVEREAARAARRRDDLLAQWHRRAGAPRQAHTCHAVGCTAHVPPEMLMCKPHWFMVPAGIRKRVLMFYTPGQCHGRAPIKPAWVQAANQAILAVFNQEAPTLLGRVRLPPGYDSRTRISRILGHRVELRHPEKPTLVASLKTGEIVTAPEPPPPSDEDPGDANLENQA